MRPKQTVRRGGEPLLLRAVRHARCVGAAWIGVVTAPRRSLQLALLAPMDITVVMARESHQGLSSSLRAGVAAAPPHLRRLLVMTVDQWRIRPMDLQALTHRRVSMPLAARYAGALGIPAVFPRRDRRRLMRLEGDRGAKALLTPGTALGVDLPRAVADLDSPSDLAMFRSHDPGGRR